MDKEQGADSFTPTTQDVLNEYVYARVMPNPVGGGTTEPELIAEFDRWLDGVRKEAARNCSAVLRSRAQLFDGYMPWKHAAYKMAAASLDGNGGEAAADQALAQYESEMRAVELHCAIRGLEDLVKESDSMTQTGLLVAIEYLEGLKAR